MTFFSRRRFSKGHGRSGFWRWALAAFLTAWLAMGVFQAVKPLPPGIGVAGPLRPVEDVAFFADSTWQTPEGERRADQQIFDEMLRLIGGANRLLVLDMFLFNSFAGASGADHRPLSRELTQAIIARKQAVPDLRAVLITDPINSFYGSLAPDHLAALREAGVTVVTTDLPDLRQSNPLWAGLWNLCCRWLGNDRGGGWLPNPLGGGEVTLRSYLRLLNFNANHRKTLMADAGESWVGFVTSANPHDASSFHDNVALRFQGPAALDLLETERAVARMSGMPLPFGPDAPPPGAVADGGMRMQILTEGRIRDAILATLMEAGPGDRIDIAMFYFSHRPLLRAAMDAAARGVELRVLLDPNKDAFGREKNGVPNRPAATELHEAGIPVRWCDTHGEQCHSKMLLLTRADGAAGLILGSANYTRRNLDDYNLETAARLLAEAGDAPIRDAAAFFEREWRNRGPNGAAHRSSLFYAAYADTSMFRYWLYRGMEATGLSTF